MDYGGQNPQALQVSLYGEVKEPEKKKERSPERDTKYDTQHTLPLPPSPPFLPFFLLPSDSLFSLVFAS